GHKKTLKTLDKLPAERILAETDAPYQPVSGKDFSTLEDILNVIEKASHIKGIEPSEMKNAISSNFQKILTKNP
ncbi:MAG TPA: TatD family hydrolase, partial [bacterium]|nr:TatD family hydrolase [bacterium]